MEMVVMWEGEEGRAGTAWTPIRNPLLYGEGWPVLCPLDSRLLAAELTNACSPTSQ